MKKILFIPLLVILIGCYIKEEPDDFEFEQGPLTHAELGFELDEPDIILNDLAKGEMNNSIHSILLEMGGNTQRKWEFEYMANSNNLSKMIFYLPHYKGCEKDVFEFKYNSQNLITSVISTRKNLCQEFEVLKTYTFNYNDAGLLKSIFMDNTSFVEENYIGYYPNGKIKEIYNGFRGRGSGVNFIVQKFYYNESFTNVVRVEHIDEPNYHLSYRYFYDENPNPFKDVFVAVSVFMPFIGPAYLSQNNVIKRIEKNENVENAFEFTTDYLFDYSGANTLVKYSYPERDHVYYINQ